MSSAPFEINDDNEILKRLKLQKTSYEDLPNLVPPQLIRYVPPEVYLESSAMRASSSTMTANSDTTTLPGGPAGACLPDDDATQGYGYGQMSIPPPPPVSPSPAHAKLPAAAPSASYR